MKSPTLIVLVTFCIALISIPSAGMAQVADATGKEVVLAPGVTVSQLTSIRSAVVSLSGANSLHVRIFEDFIAHELMSMGIDVVERGKLEQVIARQVTKLEEESQEGEQPGFVSTGEIGKLAGADIVIVGTLIDVVLQYGNSDESKNYMTGQKLQVAMTSAQFIEVRSEKTLISFAFDYGDGKNLRDAAQDITGAFGRLIGR